MKAIYFTQKIFGKVPGRDVSTLKVENTIFRLVNVTTHLIGDVLSQTQVEELVSKGVHVEIVGQ